MLHGKPKLPCVPLAQQAFFFVQETERQAMALRYEESRTRQIIRFETSLREKVSVEVLDQPLFTKEGQLALEVFTRDPLEAAEQADLTVSVDEFSCSEKEKQQHIAWIADRAEAFIGYVLDRALEALASAGNATEKADILEWMFASDIYGQEIFEEKDGERIRTIFSVDVPMSFQWCCKVFGLRPDVLQEHVLGALKHAEAHTRVRETRGEVKPGRSKAYGDALALATKL